MEIPATDVERNYRALNKDAESGGYHLNPDADFTRELIIGLLINENRYGYWACPCRLASGSKKNDLDIICPCDYRDADLGEFDACYCGLYVSLRVLAGEVTVHPIPERRLPDEERLAKAEKMAKVSDTQSLAYPVWRCTVCGYLCAREEPPEVCPVCKAKKERFENFM
ncbi:MAG: ferredoxin:glutaredoxin reductase [Spirochaetes bacterium]|nr:MAG: ferredoxin:glutaredoxin reductase [Spirochaetota bacterium]